MFNSRINLYKKQVIKINKDIEILERNKELSLKYNDNLRYIAIIKKLELKKSQLNWCNIVLNNNENYKIKKEYLYGNNYYTDYTDEKYNYKAKNILYLKNNIYDNYYNYLSNFNKSNKIKSNSYLNNFKNI